MILQPPRSTRTDTLFPYPTLFRSSGFVRRVYEAQGNAAREMLTDGKLVAAGLIDPDWLARTADGDWRDDGRDLRLLSFAAAEAWVNWWTDEKPSGPQPGGDCSIPPQLCAPHKPNMTYSPLGLRQGEQGLGSPLTTD